MKPIEHAKISAKLYGGKPEDYIEIHKWFDQFRYSVPDPRHRMFLHNTTGVIICEQVFGDELKLSDGKTVAVREVAENHILVDVGEMRTPEQWLNNMDNEEWVKPKKSKTEKLMKKLIEEVDDLKKNQNAMRRITDMHTPMD